MAEEFTKDMQGAANASKETVQNTADIKSNLEDMKLGAADLRDVLTDVLNGLTKSNQTTNDVKKSFRGLRDTATKLALNQEGINKLSLKELKSLKEKQTQNIQLLKNVEKQTGLADKALEAQKEAISFLEEENGLIKDANDNLDKQIEKAENVEKSLGKTGVILRGISKIPILGGLINAEKILGDLEEDADGVNGKMLGMGKILKSVGKEASTAIKDPAVAFGVGSKITKGLFDDLKSVVMMLDEFNGKLTKNFGISLTQATDLNKEFREVKSSADSTFVTVSGISDAFIALNAKGGTFAEFSEQTLLTFTKLNKQAGISTETLTELNDLTYLNQGTLEDTTKEFTGQLALLSGQTGQALNLKQLQEDIKNVSAAVKLNFGGSATAIAEAVFKAKALGLELKDLESISSSLLNFQSSIEDELSAELLTGRQLNLEGARYAALIGDQAMLAEELANNIGSAEEFTGMTVIAQDALAKSLGMNRNQLAETLIQQERLNSLNAKGNTLQEKYNNLKAAGRTEAEIANMLGDEQLAQQLESAGIQERFNVLVENLKEQFLPIADTLLPLILGTLKSIEKIFPVLIGAAVAFKVAQAAAAAAALATAFSLSPLTGLAILGGITAGVALLSKTIGDGIFPAGGRAILSPTEGGLIPISNNDDIVVAPGVAQAVTGGGTSQTIQNKVDISPSNTNITLSLNGQAIGNANARQNYGVGKSIRALGGNVDYSASV